MKIKIFDCEHEEDLEEEVNNFIKSKQVVDIKYQIACMNVNSKQIFCYSCLIIYKI